MSASEGITSPSLLDIYLALSHVGESAGELAPLSGEAHEETPRAHIAHTVTGEWRVFVRPDVPDDVRARLLALSPETLFYEHAYVLRLLGEDLSQADALWLGRTLLFPAATRAAVVAALAPEVVRILPGHAGADSYGEPTPCVERLRPAVAPADATPPARSVFPGEQFAALVDGRVVANCESARESALAAEAWVRTLPAMRGRGYATHVTVAWAFDVQRRGKTPFYSHHRSNQASAGVARALGLIPLLDDVGYL